MTSGHYLEFFIFLVIFIPGDIFFINNYYNVQRITRRKKQC